MEPRENRAYARSTEKNKTKKNLQKSITTIFKKIREYTTIMKQY